MCETHALATAIAAMNCAESSVAPVGLLLDIYALTYARVQCAARVECSKSERILDVKLQQEDETMSDCYPAYIEHVNAMYLLLPHIYHSFISVVRTELTEMKSRNLSHVSTLNNDRSSFFQPRLPRSDQSVVWTSNKHHIPELHKISLIP